MARSTCVRCGRDYSDWMATGWVYDRANPDNASVCLSCFVDAAEAAGVEARVWMLRTIEDDEERIDVSTGVNA